MFILKEQLLLNNMIVCYMIYNIAILAISILLIISNFLVKIKILFVSKENLLK